MTALAHAEKATRGEYAFRVSGRGTDIRQGGPFAVASGGTALLGTVTLGAGGSGYDADLTVVVDGKTISCSERVGGGI
ncbi:curli-like amyloid fiber formation chaperone CsgH [Aurantimonas sp. A2-1-M11]|uniref:curli-like amyloid fiber formation chaperone CsgH n=1 Tax=Aurantimonas sp. A2-1-M11 TaxID=3113712 RepID=UPI003FA60309